MLVQEQHSEPPLAEWLVRGSRAIHLKLPNRCVEALGQFDALLLRWNKAVNLTSFSGLRDRVRFLYLESLWGASRCPVQGTLVDLGSGCGFPALAFKLTYPECKVIMVESRIRKCHFLKEAIRRLQLAGIEVRNERFEEFSVTPGLGAFHISWRAVALGGATLSRMAATLPGDGSLIFFGTRRSEDLSNLKLLSGFFCRVRESFPQAPDRFLLQYVKRST